MIDRRDYRTLNRWRPSDYPTAVLRLELRLAGLAVLGASDKDLPAAERWRDRVNAELEARCQNL